jgi:hypothetical protein
MRLLGPKLLTTFFLGSVFMSSCGILIGNVKPVVEKSESYGVIDLQKEKPQEWMKFVSESGSPKDGEARDENDETTEISDVSFQSRRTASVISLNSACRASYQNTDKDLKGFTNLLFLGVSDVASRAEQEITVDGSPALQTTLEGTLNGERVRFRTVVSRKRNCVYDLVFVSRPKYFESDLPIFTTFVSSLRLR